MDPVKILGRHAGYFWGHDYRERLFHLCTKSSSKSAPEADEEEEAEKARKGRLATSIKLPTNKTIMSVFFVNLDHSRFCSLSFWAKR